MNCRTNTYVFKFTSKNMQVYSGQNYLQRLGIHRTSFLIWELAIYPGEEGWYIFGNTARQVRIGYEPWNIAFASVYIGNDTERDSPPASLLVAILQSTSAPFAASDTLSTETYFPLTVPASLPCLGGQSGCSNGIETVC